MKVNAFNLNIDNFDNAAMVDDRSGEVARMLEETAKRIREYGVPNCDGLYLKDINGNTVGDIAVDMEN